MIVSFACLQDDRTEYVLEVATQMRDSAGAKVPAAHVGEVRSGEDGPLQFCLVSMRSVHG